jgi:hypothetical protein
VRPKLARYDADVLLARFDGRPLIEIARYFGVSKAAVSKWRERGLSCVQADELAVRLGLHPCELWPDWLDESFGVVDELTVRLSCPECGGQTVWCGEFGEPDGLCRVAEVWCPVHGSWLVTVQIGAAA